MIKKFCIWTMMTLLFNVFYINLAVAETKSDLRDFLLTSIIAGGASIVLLDEEIQRFSQRNKLGIGDEGTIIQHGFTAMLPIFAVRGYLNDDVQAQLAARALLRGMAMNATTTFVLKEVIGRARPGCGKGAYEFKPFSGNCAMPSGHTSHSFTVATILSEIYGDEHPWVTPAVYGLAGFVAYSRIDANAHWFSDVLIGAVLGRLIGQWAVSTEERRITITPIVFNNNENGLQLKICF